MHIKRRLGPLFWVLSIQYYIVQTVAAIVWAQPFSLLHNTISDLGNTECAQYGSRFVCSPYYPFMNASFIVLGLTIILGSIFVHRSVPKNRLGQLSFVAMGLSGVGSILVGLFPENSISIMHVSGAALSFIFGNLALVGFAFSLPIPRWLKSVTLVAGLIALVALILFQQKVYLGLDIGGMERIVAYPQSLWLILAGGYLWLRRPHRT